MVTTPNRGLEQEEANDDPGHLIATFPARYNTNLNILDAWSATVSGGGGAGDLLSTNNLSDLANVGTARTNLGLGTAATQASGAFDAAGAAAAAQAAAAVATNLTSGTVPTARLGTGTADNTTFLRGDQTWATPATGGAPTTANYLVGTADAGLSAEIAVGTSPGGELGGTWASPTVDATHSGSSHATVQSAAEATAASALASHEADTTSIHGITDTSTLAVKAVGGDLSGNLPNPTVAKVNGITISGTPNGSKFLRDDGVWSAASGTSDKLGLTVTAIKTANYSPVVGDIARYDTTSGSLTGTLPTAPADGSVIAFKMVKQGSTNTVVITCGGSDVYNVAGGGTTSTLNLLGESRLIQYTASDATWTIVVADIPLAQTDLRYQQVGAQDLAMSMAFGG